MPTLFLQPELLPFAWLKIHGQAGRDDFGLAADQRLVVSEQTYAVLRQFQLENCLTHPSWAISTTSPAPGGKVLGVATSLTMPCSRSEYDKLRKKTPSQAIRDKVNDPDVKKDPIYSFDVKEFEADHIILMNEIVDMPGFDKLTETQKIEDGVSAPRA